MRAPFMPSLNRFASALRPSRLSTQGRVLGAALLVLATVFVLAGQQALHIVRQDADAALHVQATAQLAALSQAVVVSATRRDYPAVQAQLRIPIDQGNLRQVEYTAPDGRVLRQQAHRPAMDRPDWFARLTHLALPVMQEDLIVQGVYHGSLRIQPSPHAYEDFLWHLGSRLFLLVSLAIILLGWLIHALLRINLKDLTRLCATAHRIEAGDYSVRLPVRASSPPELQESARAFNTMSVALERLLADLGEQQKALDSAASVSESDLAGNITLVNDLFCILSGYTREELIGQNYRILNAGCHDDAFFAHLWETITSGRTWRGEICNRARDGRLFWTASTIIPIKDDAGLPMKYLAIRFDITQRKLDETALSNEKERWHVTLQSINDAVIVTNPHNQVTYLNPAAESLLGLAFEDARLNVLSEVIQFERVNSDGDTAACFLASAAAPQCQTGSAELYTRLGQHLAISYSCAPLADQDGLGTVYVLRDETEKKELLDNLREMAFHDTLTALPNRRAVEDRLARALRTARDLGQQHAFCYIDLDQFKLVNDTCGHSVGDGLLMDIAQTMKAALPARAYLGRLGGDEFGLILFNTRPDEAGRVCRQLVQRIRDFRFEHKGRRFTLGACAGIAPITRAATTAGDLMVQADMACYRAKSEGSGRVVLYEADEIGFRRLETEMGWAADFAQALEANQFLPFRQLIQPTSHNGQPHYEVLVRWRRDGVVEGPAKLLPALERYGQAPILDRWMLEAVVSYLAAQPDDHAVYFINLSGKTVADESFLGVVCHMLDHYGVAGSRLGFEVTETAAVVNLGDAQRLIHGLRERGCQFALDDFGRDASSFFYLKHLPADFLKIDGAFVRGMLDDRRDQAIVRSIAQLARDFGMYSVAEQVENAAMAALLEEIGVDYLQGYHIHRPEAFPAWQPVQAAATAHGSHTPHLTLIK
ncbi:MAG: PAS domain S-box protein [Thiobacillus sp. 63-78]|uniref:EAL domain-containing protein n=1 Tax=Thiobacillus sp. 63-78 TaxID=1895859 RepID=UPI0009690EE9|nr:EAL domain-containing protein [Thiobacillus sp. 63-78]MBN8763020.1 EAL domain-containing protein [Thiobacillus sp.]MBN8773560.1 EAL domain-containing protein [Thiobacillus sp.]OJZ11192.1 MAG: PAS domain S-box protein [Thiobacillus sp. 63-78]